MLSLDLLRREPDKFKVLLKERGVGAEQVDHILELYASRRKLISELDRLRAEHKRASKKVGTRGATDQDQLTALRRQSTEIKKLEEKQRPVLAQLEKALLELPSVPRMESLPVRPSGTTGPSRKVKGRGEGLGTSEPRCIGYSPVLKGSGVLLERAIVNCLVEAYTAQGFTEVMLPLLLRQDVLIASGELPVMEGYLLKCQLDDLFLIPSIEASLAYLHSDEILPNGILPLRYVSFGPSFNRRLMGEPAHRYDKKPAYPFGEMAVYSYAHPLDMEAEFSLMNRVLENLLQQLNIPYQVVLANASDLGFASELSHWHKIWFPAKKAYVQVAVTSSYGSFQATRSKTRFRPAAEQRPKHVSAVGQTTSVGLLLASVLENGQTPDGNVQLPKLLATRIGSDILTGNPI